MKWRVWGQVEMMYLKSLARLLPTRLNQAAYSQATDDGRTCRGKTRYPSRLAAKNALAVSRTRVRLGKADKLARSFYQCRVCKLWHLSALEPGNLGSDD